MAKAFLSLGSNLGNRRKQLERALEALEALSIQVEKRSAFYETEPVEVAEQPLFLNLACQVWTNLTPRELLSACLEVERQMGRQRKGDKNPRPIDIDILFYEQRVLKEPDLTLPHPGLWRRNFVLAPLVEIAPEWVDPVTGKQVAELKEECPDEAWVRRLAERRTPPNTRNRK